MEPIRIGIRFNPVRTLELVSGRGQSVAFKNKYEKRNETKFNRAMENRLDRLDPTASPAFPQQKVPVSK